jgi:hypothetical protein
MQQCGWADGEALLSCRAQQRWRRRLPAGAHRRAHQREQAQSAHLCLLLAAFRVLLPPPHARLSRATDVAAAAGVQQRQVRQQALDGCGGDVLQQ